jgi:hypothetical protein
MKKQEDTSKTKTHTDSDLSVLVDLTVDECVFERVVAVGARVVTDKDYFSIGVQHILQDKFTKEEPVAETE